MVAVIRCWMWLKSNSGSHINTVCPLPPVTKTIRTPRQKRRPLLQPQDLVCVGVYVCVWRSDLSHSQHTLDEQRSLPPPFFSGNTISMTDAAPWLVEKGRPVWLAWGFSYHESASFSANLGERGGSVSGWTRGFWMKRYEDTKRYEPNFIRKLCAVSDHT